MDAGIRRQERSLVRSATFFQVTINPPMD